MRKVPDLRFDGFDGEWESNRLKSLIKEIGTGSSKFNFIDGRFPILGSTGIIGYDDQFDYDGKLILIARVGANAGSLYKYNGKVKISDNTIFIKTKNQEYIYSLLLKKDLTRLVFGSGQPLVKSSDLKDLHVIYTKNGEEQFKIGDLFKKLDDLIEIQETKISKMRDYKKSMLQKMFPKKGELVPEFRFDGFDGKWKKLKFRDIYKTYESGNRLPKSLLKEGSIPYVLAKTTNNGIHMRIDKDTLDYNGNPMKLFNPNSITFSIDNPEAVFIQNEPFYTSNIMRVFYNENHTRTQTIFYKLQFEKNTRGFDWGIKFSGPVALDSQLFVPFKNNEIDVTEIEKIGEFFKNLDTQIENEEKLLESYKCMKKSLLQKMFV